MLSRILLGTSPGQVKAAMRSKDSDSGGGGGEEEMAQESMKW